MDKTSKIVLIGSGGVGKASIARRLTGKNFDPRYIATCGCSVQKCEIGELSCDLWDCAGQEKFGRYQADYRAKANVAIVVCDATSICTAKDAYKEFRNVKLGVPAILCINKCDIPISKLQKIVGAFAKKGIEPVIVSAKTGDLDPLLDAIKSKVRPPVAKL